MKSKLERQKIEEAVMFRTLLKENEGDIDKAYDDFELIQNLLIVQKNQTLLNSFQTKSKKGIRTQQKDCRQMLEAVIDNHISNYH
jgi:hypothetical protein